MCTLYERIIGLCKEKGVSGSRMCLDLGLSKSTLSNMKSGRTAGLSATTAQKIASYLGVSVGYLLGEEEIHDETKKEKPTTQTGDGLSETHRKLIEITKNLPLEDAALLLAALQAKHKP